MKTIEELNLEYETQLFIFQARLNGVKDDARSVYDETILEAETDYKNKLDELDKWYDTILKAI
jgi:hypothetical protein